MVSAMTWENKRMGSSLGFSFFGIPLARSRVTAGRSAWTRDILTFPRSRGMIWGTMVSRSRETIALSGIAILAR